MLRGLFFTGPEMNGCDSQPCRRHREEWDMTARRGLPSRYCSAVAPETRNYDSWIKTTRSEIN
jgi:hypothetical protein